MLRVTKELDRRHDGRRQRPQALDDRPRIVEPSHMRQAGRQRAVGRRKARQLIEGCAQRRGGFREPAVDEMSRANPSQMESSSVARVETHRGLEMLDRQIGAAGKHAKPTTPIPSVGRARIEGKRTVDQRNRGVDVVAETTERHRSTAEDPRIVGTGAKGSPRKFDGNRAVCSESAIQPWFSSSIR